MSKEQIAVVSFFIGVVLATLNSVLFLFIHFRDFESVPEIDGVYLYQTQQGVMKKFTVETVSNYRYNHKNQSFVEVE